MSTSIKIVALPYIPQRLLKDGGTIVLPNVPEDASILQLQLIDGIPHITVVGDFSSQSEVRKLLILPDGKELPAFFDYRNRFIGTIASGDVIKYGFHVFDLHRNVTI